MTILSAIMGIVSIILPYALDALSRKKPTTPKPTSQVKALLEADDEQSVEIAWAKHDADLEQLLL